MIDPKAITTYAQYNEDLVLLALLHDVKNGYYVDVGANYPVTDSVTKLFYDRGWHGINIEPIPVLHRQLQKARTKDINLRLGAGNQRGLATFHEFPQLSGHSTFDMNRKESTQMEYIEYKVPIEPLSEIFKEQKVKNIHFLKIDVEGFEYEVVDGNNWQKYRPEVICIEANYISKDWRLLLTDNKYKLFITDALNEYYVAEESWYRTEGFAERIVSLDYHALKQHQYQSWSKDSKDLELLSNTANHYQQVLKNQQSQIEQLNSIAEHSLINKPLKKRLKIALRDLTIEWWTTKRAQGLKRGKSFQ